MMITRICADSIMIITLLAPLLKTGAAAVVNALAGFKLDVKKEIVSDQILTGRLACRGMAPGRAVSMVSPCGTLWERICLNGGSIDDIIASITGDKKIMA